jgi:hypothetical protein
VDELRLPRIVPLVATLAVAAWVNDRTKNEILPAVLGILVLYAALTNIDRATALIRSFQGSLGRLYEPRARATADTGRPTGSHRI